MAVGIYCATSLAQASVVIRLTTLFQDASNCCAPLTTHCTLQLTGPFQLLCKVCHGAILLSENVWTPLQTFIMHVHRSGLALLSPLLSPDLKRTQHRTRQKPLVLQQLLLLPLRQQTKCTVLPAVLGMMTARAPLLSSLFCRGCACTLGCWHDYMLCGSAVGVILRPSNIHVKGDGSGRAIQVARFNRSLVECALHVYRVQERMDVPNP
mmetsp:Transcript_10411/g.17017  ORF Transcript_10411/g.17017 Transcript_10411/m.17017 type:complete len:209 (+) Transcript_10411:1416-2042(+)